jgi:hypothetical protein
LAWSWHGNSSDVAYLDMVTDYKGDTLTEWGETVVNSIYGMLNTSKICSVFEEDIENPETSESSETTVSETIEDTETTPSEETSETETTPIETSDTDDITTTDDGDVSDITTSTSEETTVTSSEDDVDNNDEIDWDKVVYGDVNLDGEIRITDIIEFNKYLIGILELSATARENANCVYDDRLDVSDNMQIAKYLVSQISKENLGPNK